MGRVRDRAPSQWDCVVFIAVARCKSKKRAVDYLADQHDENISVKGVETIVRKIDDWLKERTFEEKHRGNLELTIRGKRFLKFANKIVASYESERTPTARRLLPKIVCLPHHLFITSRLESELRSAHPTLEDQVLVEELGHGESSDDGFADEALFPLTLGHHEIAIGARTAAYGDELQSDLLYVAQLEVMVPAAYERDQMGLATLVGEYRAVIPPEHARARRLLESRLAEAEIDAAAQRSWVAGESSDITMSVHRVSEDHQRFGERSRRVVVAPSDVALLYKPGSRFGGSGTEASKWVPLHHDRIRLELEVFVTTTNPRPNHLRPMVDRIKEICRQSEELGGRTGEARVPRQGRESVRSMTSRPS